MNQVILLTIDVEDWFQVENFKPWIGFSTWPSRELRVERNTCRLLDLFDAIKINSRESTKNPNDSVTPKATFFILGWLAERLPHLVREIHNRGHEVASHGYDHHLCSQQTKKVLKEDLVSSKALLEDITGAPVFGYRAPSFSIDNDILKTIEASGYLYDSSFNSFDMHGRYGHADFSQNGKKGIAIEISKTFHELPVSNMAFGKYIFPWGGGGYFRLTPFTLFKFGVRSILKKAGAYLFYMHPWEIDPEQPRVSEASLSFRFRHYNNLSSTHSKLNNLMSAFRHCCFMTCKQYLDLTIDSKLSKI